MSSVFSISVDDETALIDKLKSLCLSDGSEKEENLEQTAAIFHKLGCIYANKAMIEANQKICFIQSTVLINAALSRAPNNEKMLSDLHIVCSKVLELAGVRQLTDNTDLVEIANSISCDISKMREFTEHQLSLLEKIPDESGEKLKSLKKSKVKKVMWIQKEVSLKYKNIMKIVANKCVNVFESMKSNFALVAMGSLARSEVTPYSDFENVILLSDKDHKKEVFEHFRWFAVVFQIVLVNLRETILPSIAIPTLNYFLDGMHPEQNWFYDKFTRRGISFDGLMPYASKGPLGRPFKTEKRKFTTELIQPVSKMAEFLTSKTALKEGYHLADVLSKTCFVCGDESIYHEFCKKSQEILNEQLNSGEGLSQLADQVDEDKKSFEIWENLANLHNNPSSNMKKIVYRSTTIFISALGKFYGIVTPSCFDIVEELQARNILSDEDADKLLYAVAIACEIRLRMYMNRKRQDDDLLKTVSGKQYVTELYSLVGEKSTLEYFDITYSLQIAMPNFRENEKPDRLILETGLFTIPAIQYFLHEYEKSVIAFRADLELSSKTNYLKVYAKFRIGYALLYSEKFNEAINEFKQVIEILNNMPEDFERENYLRKSRIGLGDSFRSAKLYDKALACYEEAPIAEEDLTELNSLGVVCLRLKDHDRAREIFETAIKVAEKHENPDKEWLALLIHNVGRCHYEKGNYDVALEKLLRSLELRNELYYSKKDRCFASNLYNIGRCYLKLHNFAKAEEYIERGLDIQKTLPDNISTSLDIADSLHFHAICKLEQLKYSDGLTLFEEEKSWREKVTAIGVLSIDADVERCKSRISECERFCFKRQRTE